MSSWRPQEPFYRKSEDVVTTPTLEQLEALYAAASPGEWANHLGFHVHDSEGCKDIASREDDVDACLIVALHNAFPGIAAELKHLRFANRALSDTDRWLREQLEDDWRELNAVADWVVGRCKCTMAQCDAESVRSGKAGL
jgi:hypothetical protein